jgi:GT2 family glycosyltransferase
LPSPAIVVAIPSLRGGDLLHRCVQSLERQTERDFEVIVIDNSGSGTIAREWEARQVDTSLKVIKADHNLGFAAAVNRAWKQSTARMLATLNDDAEAHPQWLAALRFEMERAPDVGMCASQVRQYGTGQLDSAGMLICLDGSSKQRGQGESVQRYQMRAEVLLPSASAALYRREMIEQIGGMDEDFFLYCEDTDLGLRARWNGWRCVYAPGAVVEHHYSQSAGAASALKAWQIERNRLWVAAKNFPMSLLLLTPFWTLMRYAWHVVYLLQGRGTASRFTEGGVWELARVVVRAHGSLVRNWSALWRKRRAIREGALLTPRQYAALLRRHAISPREIARL